MESEKRMKVEIWSDIMCPFCYIGKRRFEAALKTFPWREKVEIEWRSFELNPNLKYIPGRDAYDYIAEIKGQTREWSVRVHNGLVQTARSLGLEYNFDRVKITNSFDAHRVIQLARSLGIADSVEERFFRAYFTEGELMSDHETLIRLAVDAGVQEEKVIKILQGNDYAIEVHRDMEEARRLGIRGVPFFLIGGKYGISGAQDVSVFTEALRKAFDE